MWITVASGLCICKQKTYLTYWEDPLKSLILNKEKPEIFILLRNVTKFSSTKTNFPLIFQNQLLKNGFLKVMHKWWTNRQTISKAFDRQQATVHFKTFDIFFQLHWLCISCAAFSLKKLSNKKFFGSPIAFDQFYGKIGITFWKLTI